MHLLNEIWHYIAAALTVFIAVLASCHAILYKRDSRAAVLWVGFIWLVPLIGAVLYLVLGVNRLRRRAVFLRGNLRRYAVAPSAPPCTPQTVGEVLGDSGGHLRAIAAVVSRVVAKPLVPGNSVEVLVNGDQAYAAMLEAISAATASISFATYIFDNDGIGAKFATALGEAVRRGVEVRVLIDGTGARYSWPTTIVHRLRREGVTVGLFLHRFILHPTSMNLRNHRKICVVDGRIGFTGGMNIRDGHIIGAHPRRPVQDLHFRVRGPVVAHLQEAFADDWFFTARETLRGDKWFPVLECEGQILARGITDGPDEDFEKLRWAILGALSCAVKSVTVVTPYFLPDQSIISALNVAAMRGVEINLLIPSKNNLPYVQWAMFAILWQVLQRGCRVWLMAPPFDHSKLMLVDGHWALVGSGNWDPRSFRLNFEFNVECYGREVAEPLEQLVRDKLRGARELTLAEVDARPFMTKLRDGVARLATPFL